MTYNLWYHVAHVDSVLTNQLQEVVASAMRPVAPKAEEGAEKASKERAVSREYVVQLQGAVEDKLSEIHDIYFPSSAKRNSPSPVQEGGRK